MAQELWGYCQQLHTLLSLVRPVFQDNIFHAPIDLGYTELTCCLSALTVGCFLGTCWFAAFQRLAIAGVRKPAKAVQLWNSSKGRCWSSRVWLADGFLGDSSWRNFGLDDCISSMVYLLAEVSSLHSYETLFIIMMLPRRVSVFNIIPLLRSQVLFLNFPSTSTV